MGLADRLDHMPQCSPSALVRFLLQARERLVQAASLMRVRKVAADREAVEDDLLCRQQYCHRSSRETAERGRPTTKARTKL
jgi:hypothetical protein